MGQLHFSGAIFDLDGVVTRTAHVHAAAWKQLFDGFLKRHAESTGTAFGPFDLEQDYATYVDGKPRIDGVRSFLSSRGIELPAGTPDDPPGTSTAWGLGNEKNRYFREALEKQGAEVDEQTVAFIRRLRECGIKTAVASSSKNCDPILATAGLKHLFEDCVDGIVSETLQLSGKPAPDIFIKAAELLGLVPSECLVVEDASVGVEAGRRGGFGLVIGIDQTGDRTNLYKNGADLVVESLENMTVETVDAWFENRQRRKPSALGAWEKIAQRLTAKQVAVFLDYDGTLTPIVSRPELAVLSTEMRQVVRELGDRCPTAILSGRGREDVQSLVQLDSVYVAGSHGFDIAGPSGTSVRHEVDQSLRPIMKNVASRLEKESAGIEGALVEYKAFSVALHYRLVQADRIPELEGMVDRVVGEHPQLRKAHGKKVFEVRPKLDWDKGKALRWLLNALDLAREDVIPIYIGDDTTDEDAFSAIRGDGIGVVVTEAPRPTAASYALQSPDEVRIFLRMLVSFLDGVQ